MDRRKLIRGIGWTAAILVVLVGLGAIGGYFYLRSRSFQEYAIRTIAQDAHDATGARTEIRSLDFQLSTLTAHLYGIVLHGTEAAGQPPLLQVDKLTVGIKILSLLHRKFTLSELLIEHPVAHLRVSSDGKNNIPQAPPSQSSSSTSVFDLAIRHAQLSNGQVNYNDQQTPLDADLYDLGAEIRFDSVATRYSGTISYDNGHLHYANYATLPHNLNAQFAATPSGLTLEKLELKVANSSVSAHAELTNYSDPTATGNYDIRLHTQDFASMAPGVAPAGDVSLSGKIQYHGVASQPLLRNLLVDGDIASQMLAASSTQGRLDLRQLRAHYKLENGTFSSDDATAGLLGGELVARANLPLVDANATSQIHMSLSKVSLQAAQQSVRLPQSYRVKVISRLDGTAEASWKGNISNISGRADFNLASGRQNTSNSSNNGTGSGAIPVDGAIHASYDGSRSVLALRQTSLHIPALTLTADGEASQHSRLQIKLDSQDLHQVEALASILNPGGTPPPAVSGSASLSATIQGSLQQPQINGQLSLLNLQVEGSEWKSARVTLQADPSQIAMQNGELVNAHQGKASFEGKVTLTKWSYLPSNPVALKLSVQQMSVADLQKLARLQYPVTGDLTANVSLHGSQRDPAGSGSATIANAQAYGEPLRNLAAKFGTEKGSITSSLDLATAAGSANATLSYTLSTKAYKVNVNAPAIVLEKLHTVQARNMALTGTVTASASGEGTVDNPQLTATISLPQLQFRQNTIAQLKADLHVANQRADLTVNSEIAQASVRAHGVVNLTGDYYTDAQIDTGAVELAPLLAVYAPTTPAGFKGQTELHATLKGPLKDKSQVEAHLSIPTFHATYQNLQIGAAGPIRADYAHSVITLQPAEIRGTGTSLHLQGSFPLEGATSANLSAQGSLDMSVLRILQPDMESSGALALDLHASGAASNPVLQGQVHIQNVALSTPDAPLGVEKLNGTLDLENDRVQVSDFKGQVGGGEISMGGSVAFRPAVQFNLTLQSQSVRLRYPDGLRAVLDGNLTYIGNVQSSSLNGRVLIDSLSFTPDFDVAKFGDQFGGSSAPAQPGFADTVQLRIGVQSRNDLNATSSQVSLAGRANLQVVGTAANPVITGRTDLTSGELFYRNLRYQLQRGIITFSNPTETDPVMDVSLTTTVEQYNLTLNLRGSFDKLTTSYTSDPPLSSADIINLIALGKTTQESAAAGQSTDSMIASQAASQFSGGVQKLAGLSALQIDPQLGGNGQNPGARIALQQRVSKNFLFTFSTDVSQPGSEIVQGDYQLNPRWSVSVARDQLGGVSVDGKFHTKF